MIFSIILSLFIINFSNCNDHLPDLNNINHIVTTNYQQALIISHRGASGYIPEHSIPAYKLAIDLQTDYIEPDLCLSKDGVFVALHDLLLDDTTNIASFPEYNNRKRTQLVDGKILTGYFVNDFTISELKELRLNQRLPQRTQLYNDLFEIPTLDEIMNLLEIENNQIGIFPELKHPSYFNSERGFSMEDMLLEQLSNYNKDLIMIQCFEENTLISLRNKTDIPLILLVEDNDIWNNDYLKNISKFANGIGPKKDLLDYKKMEMAHNNNLKVYPWTFRADDVDNKFNTFEEEQLYYIYCLGVDGLFTEFPDRSREIINLSNNYTLECKSSPSGLQHSSSSGKSSPSGLQQNLLDV
jgi:glycerophosphoryl diester phosphodiesterase